MSMPDGDGGDEQAEPDVDAEGERGEGAGDGHMAEGVAGEDLAAQHQEVADGARRHGDAGAGQEGIAHVGLSEDPACREMHGVPRSCRHRVDATGRSRAGHTTVAATIGGERQRRDPEADRVRGVVGDGQPHPGHREPDPDGEGHAQHRSGGELLGGGGRHHQQGEHEQGAGDLAGLGGGQAEQDQEEHGQPTDGHALGHGHVGVDGCQQERPARRRRAR